MAGRPRVSEREVKAAFLYYFAKFADWPKSAFPDPASPVIVGVLGEDPFGDVLEKTLSGKKARGRPFALRRTEKLSEAARCHILFISASLEKQLPRIAKELGRKPILTVSDLPRFARRGGMIGIVRKGKKLSLEFDIVAARAAKLSLRYPLLKVGTIVRGKPKGGGGKP